MNNIKRKIIGIFFLAFCLFSIQPKADDFSAGQIVDGSLLTDEMQAFDTKEMVIEDPFDQEITPFGTYLSNGGWSTIKMHSNTAYNTYVVYAGVSFSVPKGYYYRVKGAHYAKKGGVTESTTTCSSGIYIS